MKKPLLKEVFKITLEMDPSEIVNKVISQQQPARPQSPAPRWGPQDESSAYPHFRKYAKDVLGGRFSEGTEGARLVESLEDVGSMVGTLVERTVEEMGPVVEGPDRATRWHSAERHAREHLLRTWRAFLKEIAVFHGRFGK